LLRTTSSLAACTWRGNLVALAKHPNGSVLYGLTETELITWRVRGDSVERLATTALLLGEEACAVAATASSVVVAHYASGSITVFALGGNGEPLASTVVVFDGSGPDRDRQTASHPHHVLPVGEQFVVTDLGADRLWWVTEDGDVVHEVALPAGFGPRHTAQLPDGRLVSVGELAADVAVISSPLSASPSIDVMPSSTVTSHARCYPSDLAITPEGIVVVANRGTNTVAVFVAGADGLERSDEASSGGVWPLNLALVERALYVADRDSDRVVRFGLDADRAVLTQQATFTVPSPTWVISVRPSS